ncbi:FtsX-like permease family protein [Desulfobacter postgatei]|jgi:putative ABC transport system permease protein|uniref:ABC transporter permease n=1 Tax=Desulfobacter postgatei TaxID=2293 RepID=UPI002A36098E|nr:FtsX-like permease family protein [Desulfobacter postgatei]MDX9962630.1 FtsX-like permease family protein [Desulfobacter postgatei]
MKLPISFKLAVKNVFRNRIRTAITIAAISFGSISMILSGGFFEDTFLRMRESVIHSRYGHLQLTVKGFKEKGSLAPFNYLISNTEEVIQKIEALEHVKLVTPRISFFGMLSTGENTISVLCQGVDPEKEARLSVIDSLEGGLSGLTIQSGRDLNKDDDFAAIIGRGLAKSTGSSERESVVLLTNTVEGGLNAFDIEIKGLFYTASKEFDDRALRVPIQTAQQLLRTDNVLSLVILLDKTRNTEMLEREIRHLVSEHKLNLEVTPWTELADFYNKTVELYGRQFFVLQMIIVVIVVLSIFNTINIAIWERTREIGTIMAMGYKQRYVLKMFLIEGVILGFIGGILGVLSGCAAAWIISIVGIPMPPPPGATVGWTAMIKIVPGLLTSSFILSVAAAILSSFYPAFKASRMVITEALRHY